ncbi:urokinase plasminogen activator surface receptor-like isoform X3 [Thunnus albacares]|uniref:urokinase plasminogen activator surface receptor-like isoform X3 n=1 Tax=Thunnus albacares TaxID=8236 RepID=UPI001CF6DA3A|nr:urokinase plasminogen activator surface receptor-like isoform X3 [Thunnus albacares]
MMKLILSLTLIWTLSSTAEAVDCWTGHTKQQELLPCNSTELCATFAFQGYGNGTVTQDTIRFCLSSSIFSEGNHTFSFNDGFGGGAASVHMCNTDGCNSEIIPHPAVQKKNNLQCFTCDDRFSAVCNKTLQCVGEQDHCISGTVGDIDNKGGTFPVFGCVSANLCQVVPRLELLLDAKFLHAPKCCRSSFCNSLDSLLVSSTRTKRN